MKMTQNVETKGKELYIDEQGRLKLPEEILRQWGITSETRLSISQTPEGLLLQRDDPQLSRLYIEPTNACNLNCRTCVRNSWQEPIGLMNMETYRKLIADLRRVPSLQKISFWGFGEPLLHPDIVEMVSLAKQLGVHTQMITNALLLNFNKAKGLVDAGLDSIVVSVDGTTSETNADIRSGADLELVKKNIHQLRDIRRMNPRFNPEIGIEFVVMRKNISELRNLRKIAYALGASFIVLTNLLPYTEELKGEITYDSNSGAQFYPKRSKYFPEISLPLMDLNPEAFDSLLHLTGFSDSISTNQVRGNANRVYCRFVGEGSVVVAWDGAISPCIPLMHSYSCYITGRNKQMKRYVLGQLDREELTGVWNKQEFIRFRDTVKHFDFSPCAECGGCDLSESNEEDCFGNTFPTCGDCLWAKGIIQCP